MEFPIRRAELADIPEIVRVVRTVYDEYGFTWDEQEYHADLYDIEGHYDRLGHSFFVVGSGAIPSERLLGVVALKHFAAVPGSRGESTLLEGIVRLAGADCSLDRLYVDPAARRQGLGSALTEHVIRIARSEGKSAMEIWSDKRFVEAHRLYQRLGAFVVADRICSDPDNSPEWGLLLPLDAPEAPTL